MGKLALQPEPDGMGYFYGVFQADDGGSVRVDVLPPKSHPRPGFVLGRLEDQHETQWIVYADGVEFARVGRREDLDTLDIDKLLAAR